MIEYFNRAVDRESFESLNNTLSNRSRCKKSFDSYLEASLNGENHKNNKRWVFDLQWRETYFGNLTINNLHGEGVYKWPTATIRGNFYANNSEGYGRYVSVDEDLIFEGLYKKNKPYGPGVLMYPNGTQDVGFWDDQQLVRLSCCVYPDWIPKLGKTALGKTRLLGFRNIISLEAETHRQSVANEILKTFTGNKETLSQSDKLYSSLIRNPNSNFFNRPMYDETFYGDQDYVIQVALRPEEISEILSQRQEMLGNDSDYQYTFNNEDTTNLTKYIKVTELLAWNNGNVAMEMLKHTFLNRKSENNVSFKLHKLVSGNRKAFFPAGKLESACIEFLKACSNGNRELASKLFLTYILNPDVCDCKGNSGIIYAAARDRTEIIKDLWKFDANIDFCNDEGLTALTLCLCRYLALKYQVIDWEQGFLLDIDPDPNGHNEENIKNETFRTIYPDPYNISTFVENNEISSKTHLHPSPIESLTNSAKETESSCDNCQTLKYSSIMNLIEENAKDKITMSFTKIVSLIEETDTDNGDNAIEEKIKQMLMEEIVERTRKDESEPDFKEFQEPYAYVTQPDVQQKCLFQQEYVVPPKKKIPKQKKPKKSKAKKSGKKTDKTKKRKDKKVSRPDVTEPQEPTETEEMVREKIKAKKLSVIARTVLTLLEMGSDPNVGDVPLPVLLLSTYALNPEIFSAILPKCNDPNVTTPKDGLTPFHILASFPVTEETVKMCVQLNERPDANAKLRASTNHWSEQKEKILTKAFINVEDEGKCPLHLFCMRADYTGAVSERDMCLTLLKAGSDPNSHYLGHTALTLAMIKGNTGLMEVLLESGLTDPNRTLGLNMGTPLTVLLLKRYKNLLPADLCKEIYEMLVKYGANPLNPVGGGFAGNAIEFDQIEQTEPARTKKSDKSDSRKSSARGKAGSRKSSKEKKNKKGKDKLGTQDILRQFLIETARDMITQHNLGKTVKLLYDMVACHISRKEKLFHDLTEHLDLKTCKDVLQVLIQEGAIKNPNLKVCYDLFRLVAQMGPENTDKKNDYVLYDMANKLDLKIAGKSFGKFQTRNPIADDTDDEKYEVCFECLTKMDQPLIRCPECEQVFFCSLECNRHNNKRKPAKHLCRNLFYKHEKAFMEKQGGVERTSRLAEMRTTVAQIKRFVEVMEQKRKEKEEANRKLGLVVNKAKSKIGKVGAKGETTNYNESITTSSVADRDKIKTRRYESLSSGKASYYRKDDDRKMGRDLKKKFSENRKKGTSFSEDDTSEPRNVDKLNQQLRTRHKNQKDLIDHESDKSKNKTARSYKERKGLSSKIGDYDRKLYATERKSKTRKPGSKHVSYSSTDVETDNEIISKRRGYDSDKYKNKAAKSHKERKGLSSESDDYYSELKTNTNKSKTKKSGSKHISYSGTDTETDHEKISKSRQKKTTSSVKQSFRSESDSDYETETGKPKKKRKDAKEKGKLAAAQKNKPRRTTSEDGSFHKKTRKTEIKSIFPTRKKGKVKDLVAGTVQKSGDFFLRGVDYGRNKKNEIPNEKKHFRAESDANRAAIKQNSEAKHQQTRLMLQQIPSCHQAAGRKRLPLRFLRFMQEFAAYFQHFDWLYFMFPYTVYYREQLYYRFFEDYQIFIGSYSDV